MSVLDRTASSPYAELCRLGREAETLSSIGSLLNWDQETYMPRAAASHRADQVAMLSQIHHERMTDQRIGELIQACEDDPAICGNPSSAQAANVREFRRDYELATRLPVSLVKELAHTGSQAQEAWKHARDRSDVDEFSPWLKKMIELSRAKAECYGVPEGGLLYDALLDQYEPGARSAKITAMFATLKESLTTLLDDVRANGTPPDEGMLHLRVPTEAQQALGQLVLRAMGFDFAAGRLDTTTHPFCSGMAPGDTRLTTRYHDEKFTDSLYGTMHEGGHGLYEQGLPKRGQDSYYGSPLGEAVSLGIHESQSLMWENFVGRSRAFWEWALPHANKLFGGALDGYSPEDLYRANNTASPSLIRVEADEATYNLHVIIRFELEQAMIAGELSVDDLPDAWNAKYKDALGIEVPDDRRGCLQDVHWSFGLIGYFPTYTLGYLYAAQMWVTINQQLPDLESQMRQGEFGALKAWLNQNVHAHGRRYRPGELCKMLTGRELSAEPFMHHLEQRIRPIYKI